MLITQLLVRRCPYITKFGKHSKSRIHIRQRIVWFRKIHPNRDFLRADTRSGVDPRMRRQLQEFCGMADHAESWRTCNSAWPACLWWCWCADAVPPASSGIRLHRCALCDNLRRLLCLQTDERMPMCSSSKVLVYDSARRARRQDVESPLIVVTCSTGWITAWCCTSCRSVRFCTFTAANCRSSRPTEFISCFVYTASLRVCIQNLSMYLEYMEKRKIGSPVNTK